MGRPLSAPVGLKTGKLPTCCPGPLHAHRSVRLGIIILWSQIRGDLGLHAHYCLSCSSHRSYFHLKKEKKSETIVSVVWCVQQRGREGGGEQGVALCSSVVTTEGKTDWTDLRLRLICFWRAGLCGKGKGAPGSTAVSHLVLLTA